jgi:hypothetical protein
VIVGEGEFYQIGRITRSVGDYHLALLRPPRGGPATSHLFSSDHLCADDADRFAHFFDTERELDEWLAIETPGGDGPPRVVSMTRMREAKTEEPT